MLLLDTNIIIGYLAQDLAVVKKLDTRGIRGDELALATMSVVEVLSFPALTPADQVQIESFFRRAVLLDLTPSVARHAATVRRQHRLTAADAIIAATALEHKIPLMTRDRAFSKVTGLTLV